MFKHTVMAFAIAGLIAGSIHAETESSKARIAKHVDAFRDAVAYEYVPNELCFALSGSVATFALIMATLASTIGTPPSQNTCDCLQTAVKVFLGSGAVAGYNWMQLNAMRRKLDALRGIQEELEKEALAA